MAKMLDFLLKTRGLIVVVAGFIGVWLMQKVNDRK